MKNYKISLNKKCPCPVKECPIKGNCVLCVQNHLEHKLHIPKCMQNLLRKDIEHLAKMVEFEPKEMRVTKEFWKTFDEDNFVKETLERHK